MYWSDSSTAQEKGLRQLTADVIITANPLFRSFRFRRGNAQVVTTSGVELTS